VWSPKTTDYWFWIQVTVGFVVVVVVLEYNLYLINWTRADFAPQIQIRK